MDKYYIHALDLYIWIKHIWVSERQESRFMESWQNLLLVKALYSFNKQGDLWSLEINSLPWGNRAYEMGCGGYAMCKILSFRAALYPQKIEIRSFKTNKKVCQGAEYSELMNARLRK